MTAQVETAQRWRSDIAARVAAGDRFAGLYGTAVPEGCRLTAILATPTGFELLPVTVLAADGLRYPSLTPLVSSAF